MVSAAAGIAPIVTSTVNVEPVQPLADGVTVYSTTPCTLLVLVNTSAIVELQPALQLPFPITEPVITEEVHVKLVPVPALTVEFNDRLLDEPLQITILLAEPIGVGFTVSVTVSVPPVQPDELGVTT